MNEEIEEFAPDPIVPTLEEEAMTPEEFEKAIARADDHHVYYTAQGQRSRAREYVRESARLRVVFELVHGVIVR